MNYPAPFSKNQYRFFWKCFDNWFNVAEGGKRGGKNVLTTMAFCTILEKHPSKLHLVAGVSTATARLNILDCDGFGVMNYFEGRCRTGKYENRDCLYVGTSTGEKIILISGGRKKGDEAFIKGNTYGTAYITEANECHPVFIQEVFDRTISSPNRKIFHDLNPKSPYHWYYTGVLDFHEEQQAKDPNYGYNYGHFTIADNMSISDSQLRGVLKTYDKNSIWYSRDIKGERLQATGLVYPNFDNVVKAENRAYTRFMLSMDYGIQNPTAMLLWGFCGGIWYLVREYYHSGRETNEQKTDEEYYDALCELCGEDAPERIIVDPSASSFITLILRKGKYRVRKADNTVIEGIQHTASALADRRILINDCCVNTIREFSLYSWDSDSVEDRVIKENDHCMDALRYFVQTERVYKEDKPYKGVMY